MQQEPQETQTSPTEPLSYWLQTAPSLKFSSRLPARADLVIIGGGLLGAATCYWAARNGISVVLLERTALASGATGRNGGFIAIGPDEAYAQAIQRLGYATARAILEVTLESRALLRQVLEEESIFCDYREPGHLHLTLEEGEMETFEFSRMALQQDGIPSFLFDRKQVQEYVSTPLGPRIRGALFIPNVGLVHPVKLVQGLIMASQRYAAQIIKTTVLSLHADGEGIRLQTTQGTTHAGSVIIATNAWASTLIPHLKDVITPVRGQVLTYQPCSSLFPTGVTIDLAGSEAYWQQAPDGTIILGGCRSVAEGFDIGIQVSQPTTLVQNALEQVFPSLFPQISGLQVVQRWAGLMAFTHDLLPIADRIPSLPNTWVVGGFSGHGMPFGLRFGQLLAEAARTSLTPSALAPFRQDRATLK